MRALAFIAGLLLAVMMLYDLFDTIILPKRAESHWRPTAMFFKYSWMPVRKIGRHIKSGAFRERFLSFYGPLSLVLLFVVWAAGIITGFALMDWDAGLRVGNSPATIGDSLYASANAFFTLGLVQRSGPELSFLLLLEAALGFGFLALLVGYLPVLYQAFSRREVRVSLLDPRAGSPPSAGELIRREGHSEHRLEQLFVQWEEWTAELMETHTSYPVLAYFRSHHNNQSWVAALTAILDATAFVSIGPDNAATHQARLTFAMARHVAVDLSTVFNTRPEAPETDRLPGSEWMRLLQTVKGAGSAIRVSPDSYDDLLELRRLYEPYAAALGKHFLMALPPWLPTEEVRENWRRTKWRKTRTSFAASDPFQAGSDEAA